jgi:hypothetical protein
MITSLNDLTRPEFNKIEIISSEQLDQEEEEEERNEKLTSTTIISY